MYSEELLRNSKYNELLKIAKEFGIKRQKTEKLISSILKAQNVESSNKNIASIDDSESLIIAQNEEELLEDISEPNLSFDLCNSVINANLDGLDKSLNVSKQLNKSLKGSLESLGGAANDDSKGIRRSQTFSVNRDGNLNKRKLSPKLNSSVDEPDNQSPSKRRKTSNNDFSISCNSTDIIKPTIESVESSAKCLSSKNKIEQNDNSPSNTSTIDTNSTIPSGRKSLRGKLLISRLSNVRRRSNVIVPTVGVEAPTIINRRKSQTSPLVKKSSPPNKPDAGTSSLQIAEKNAIEKEEVPSKILPSKIVERRSLSTSLKRNPTFNIGKSPAVKANNVTDKGSNIPRFVAYARKMKMPDFNKIHNNAFKKMEALDDYVGRKNISSAVKKSTTKCVESSFNPSVTKVEEVKLNFTDKANMNFGKPLQKFTPRTSSHFKRNSTVAPENIAIGRNSAAFCLKEEEKKVPKSPIVQKEKKISSFARKHLTAKRELPSKGKLNDKPSGLPKLVKEDIAFKVGAAKLKNISENSSTQGSLNRRKLYKSDGLNRPTNFKRNAGSIHREKSINRSVLKEMVEKNPRVKQCSELRDSQKMYIKGVRTNKRFALQMAKRGIHVA